LRGGIVDFEGLDMLSDHCGSVGGRIHRKILMRMEKGGESTWRKKWWEAGSLIPVPKYDRTEA
jgi:hypothetical protein